MVAAAPPAPSQFSDGALAQIAATLPPDTPPERARLLPDLLRAWAAEDLREHQTRDGRAAIRKQGKRLAVIADQARGLLDALSELDEREHYVIALKVQIRHEAKSRAGRWAMLGLPDDPEAGERRRDGVLLWLRDLAGALSIPSPKPPPDKKTLGYLVVLDLAAIYQLVTVTAPTRRNNANAEGGRQPYGPFWNFCSEVFTIVGLRSLERAIKDVLADYPETVLSAFVANLQFRHPDLWQALR
jgi:hypothetical protein